MGVWGGIWDVTGVSDKRPGAYPPLTVMMAPGPSTSRPGPGTPRALSGGSQGVGVLGPPG